MYVLYAVFPSQLPEEGASARVFSLLSWPVIGKLFDLVKYWSHWILSCQLWGNTHHMSSLHCS